MQLELRSIAPLRAANLVSVLYGLSMLIFAIPMFALFSFLPEPAVTNPQQSQIPFSMFRWVFIAYPIFGVVFGWFTGFLGAFFYNLIAARLGGLQLEYLSPTPDR